MTLQTDSQLQVQQRRLPVGAEILSGGGVHFRLWAPRRSKVEVVFEEPLHARQLEHEADGYFSAFAQDARAGMRYRFRLDGGDKLLPDPVSRYQPQGVHGPSQIVDPNSFEWTDQDWRGIGPAGQVLYELHIGTFTHEGTWASAMDELERLAELGITCLEVMPVNEFAGRFGWGYDGVDLFAPYHHYGTPDDFRRFVNRAHELKMAVILDVVYNHIGPEGNYLREFSEHYFSTKHKNDWGESLNFDGEGSAGVREFFISNARYWIDEFHLDGFRFDATHVIVDSSCEHILAAICKAARQVVEQRGRSVYLINENEPQHTCVVRSCDDGGYGMDALWNDDFHHSAMVALSGRNEAYYTDYLGHPQEFVSACKWGYLFQGQIYSWQKKRRGTPALDLPPVAFVNYIQNHDQIANSGHGLRADRMTSPAHLRAMTALLLLAPQAPMLFQGQEWASSTPFYYFADHNPDLAKLVAAGRAREMSQFPSVAQPEMQQYQRDPADPETFDRCKLDSSERERGWHIQIYDLHRDLLRLRREDRVFGRVQRHGNIDGAVIDASAFVLRYFGSEPGHYSGSKDDRLVVINFGNDLHLSSVPEPLLAPLPGTRWQTLWSSEHPKYGGTGTPPLETLGEDWRLPGAHWYVPARCTLVLHPVPDDQRGS